MQIRASLVRGVSRHVPQRASSRSLVRVSGAEWPRELASELRVSSSAHSSPNAQDDLGFVLHRSARPVEGFWTVSGGRGR
jgi:hypothetical protein